MNLFTKGTKKNKSSSPSTPDSPSSRSPTKKSPSKSSSFTFSSTRDRDRDRERGEPSRSSSSHGRIPSRGITKSPRHTFDSDTHPLNLPPEQYRRLSAMSGVNTNDSFAPMDIDPPSSPVVSTPLPQSTPGAFPSHNGVNTDGIPVPPPHRVPTSPQSTLSDAEAFKTAGNKFFKAKKYD